jgi:hypothetical protein
MRSIRREIAATYRFAMLRQGQTGPLAFEIVAGFA